LKRADPAPNYPIGGTNVPANTLEELYVTQLQDLYSAEQQIIKALPKMISEAQADDLREALTEHLEVTKTQAERLETICEELGVEPQKEKCKGMEGVLKEGSDLLKESGETVRDAAIIAAGQRVEHYEMAGYGTARAYAELLGHDEAASMLGQSLSEEKEADETLSGLAENINVEANEADSEEATEVAGTSKSSKTQGTTKKTSNRNKRVA
jgi:ferritin-like metal-binding protein YciE